MSTSLAVWLAGLGTIAIYSYLIGDNLLFKLTEHMFVGMAAGHAITMGYGNIRDLAWIPLVTKGKIVLVIPLLLGVLLYARFIKRAAWLNRYPIAVLVGIGVGMLLRGMPAAQIISQIRASMVPMTSLNDFVIFFGVLGTIVYFFFTFFVGKQNAAKTALSQVGRWTMMITFGATFGQSVFSLIARGTGAVTAILRIFGLAE